MLPTRIVPSIAPLDLPPARVAREFRDRVARGARIRAVGQARCDPEGLLSGGYTPRYELELFDTTVYLTRLREDQGLRFFVAYVVPGDAAGRARPEIHPRIFYKDSSLVWRSPSHCILTEDENWIGKGDLKEIRIDGRRVEYAAEETTNLPLEMQAALDALSRLAGPARRDRRAVPLVLRNAPDGRLEPYRDFSEPRRRAMADPRNRINRGAPVARFTRRNDPTSLEFARGYEPDFRAGILDRSRLRSRIYGGEVHKFRILSANRRIQYQFVAAPRHVWIIPPQSLTTELSSFGVRTVDVSVDEDLCVPGYEYHYLDDTETPPRLHSQIPEGFAGRASEVDPSRADASPWLERLPVIREFRHRVPLPRSFRRP